MRRYILIVFCALVCAYTHAQTELSPEIRYFISLNGDLGYSALLHNIENYKPSSGMNANIGASFRFYHNKFIMSAGVEASYQLNINKIENMDFSLPMKDTEGDLFNMHVLVYKSQDRTHTVNMNVPVLVGGEWQRFYFMVGPKVGINMFATALSEAEYSTYGEYERYYADFHNMENHQFVTDNQMVSGVLDMKWNMNLMAHVEVGARVDDVYKHRTFRINPDMIRMYLSAYVDFGLLNLISSQKNPPIFDYRDTEDKGLQFYIQPLMRSSLANDAFVRNLNVGIKYTVAFEMPQKGKSYIYDYNKVGQDYRKRGGNQSIQ